MTQPKSDNLDCVEVKRRAQRELAKALAGQSPDEQAKTLHHLAAKNSLWNSLAKQPPKKATRSTRTATKRRSTG